MIDILLASGISNQPHLSAFDQVVSERLTALELEKLLIYVIDLVDEDALYPLAVQFDVMGVGGWELCTTVEEKRTLVKRAIELHRYKGTPYGIKRALESVGFPGSLIVEGFGEIYDGDADFDGSIYYSKNNWANFRVIVNLGNDKGISAEQTFLLERVIKEYKNVRSHLVDIVWRADLEDAISPSDDMSINLVFHGIEEELAEGISYVGSSDFNGAKTYIGTYNDPLEVTEIT